MTAPVKPWQKSGHNQSPMSSASTGISDTAPTLPLNQSYDPVNLTNPQATYPFATNQMSSLGGYGGGYVPSMGYGGMYGGMQGMYGGMGCMGSDQMFTGILGQTAESLGKLNNLLSMTGMLVEHVSNHAKLLFVKAQEFYMFCENNKLVFQRNKTDIYVQLGLIVDPNEYKDLEERKKQLFLNRLRSSSVFALIIIILVLLRRRRSNFERAFRKAAR
jgi:hypothetical protein